MSAGEKYGSLDVLIEDFYEAISFAPNAEPDWASLRLIFKPGASLVPPRAPEEDTTHVFDLEQFIERATAAMASKPDLANRGFREHEVARRMEAYDAMVQIFSTYEGSFWGEKEVIARGINSMQVLLDDGRWWIVSVMWSNESEDRPIPDNYLTGKI